jgi:hypothetical protein
MIGLRHPNIKGVIKYHPGIHSRPKEKPKAPYHKKQI